MNKCLLCLLTLLCLISCKEKTTTEDTAKSHNSNNLSYATKFAIDGTKLIVLEPWPGALQSRTYEFETPPKRIVVTSTTHLPYLELLGLEDKLVGFVGTDYITSENINKRLAKGTIKEVGTNGAINLELLLSCQPDVVIVFDMGNESATLDKISAAGIPIIYNADFLENSALGRAEWIKFFGALFDVSDSANAIFDQIANRYNELKSLTDNLIDKPKIFSGVMYGDAWFLPGGQNWSAQFLKDAGGTYIWGNDATSGWLEVSFEAVLNKARTADFWIGVASINSLTELAAQDLRYTYFEAYQKGNIFNHNKRLGPHGGFDFFESAYARPDLVLADLIGILHPELLPDHEFYYFQKLP
jgi:iron complex transport system substrate-binding protein